MCGSHFYSMKITEDVGKFSAEQGIADEMSCEFIEKGSELFAKE